MPSSFKSDALRVFAFCDTRGRWRLDEDGEVLLSDADWAALAARGGCRRLEDFFDLARAPANVDEAVHLLQAARGLLRHVRLEDHARFESACFHRFSKKIWRASWNRKADLDKAFIDAEVHPYSESFRVQYVARGPERIVALDLNSNFPSILASRPFFDPARMQRITRESEALPLREDHIWIARFDARLRTALPAEDRDWFSRFHPFRHTFPVRVRKSIFDPVSAQFVDHEVDDLRAIPFAFNAGETHRITLFSFEYAHYARFLDLTFVDGIIAPAIEHPLKRTMQALLAERFSTADPVLRGLAKQAMNIGCSAAYRAPKFDRTRYAKWRASPEAWRSVKGVFAHTVTMRAYARLAVFDALDRWRTMAKTSGARFEAFYCNVDCVHFVTDAPERLLGHLRAAGDLDETVPPSLPGKWKLEWTADHAVWPAPRFYWIADGMRLVTFASINASDPAARFEDVRILGEPARLYNQLFWREMKYHRLSPRGFVWTRPTITGNTLPQPDPAFPTARLLRAVGRLLRKTGRKRVRQKNEV